MKHLLNSSMNDFFEGDGPLGIKFVDVNGGEACPVYYKWDSYVEYYDLKTEMILVGIGTKDVTKKSFSKKMKMIEDEWEQNMIYLKFKKKVYGAKLWRF